MSHPIAKPLQPKKHPISDDYRLTGSVLGLGINGKVLECYARSNSQKFALKVSPCKVCFFDRECVFKCFLKRAAITSHVSVRVRVSNTLKKIISLLFLKNYNYFLLGVNQNTNSKTKQT